MIEPAHKIHRVCETLGIRVPIVQAPIGPAATPELVAAVCNAGGYGHARRQRAG